MATVASLVANPILWRNPHPKYSSAAKLSVTANSRHASFVSSSAPKFNVRLKSCCFSQVLGTRNASLCMPPNATKDHLGIGKPLGRVGGKWSTAYPYDPRSHNPTDDPLIRVFDGILTYLFLAMFACCPCGPLWVNYLALTILTVLKFPSVWRSGETSVIKLQVGFSGKGQDLGFDLNQIAETADTSTYEGLSYVLKETVIALLRHLEYNNSIFISVVSKFGRHAANSHIDKLSFEERIENKETLVNVSNMKLQSSTSQKSANDRKSDDMKVTLFVAFNGRPKLSTVYNKYELENLLHELRSIGSSNCLTAVEILWTPQGSSCSPASST